MVQLNMDKKTIRVEISYKTIVFMFVFLVAVYILWNLKSILALFFICAIFMEALNPIVSKLEQKKISRPVAVILIYIVILVLLSTAFASVVPPLLSQVNGLFSFLPRALSQLDVVGINASDLSAQFKLMESLPSGIAKTTISIFSNIFGGILVMMITFYMLLERTSMDKGAKSVLGEKRGKLFMEILTKVEDRLTDWMRAEGLLMLLVGGLSYVGYMILGIDFALALAIVAGILELIPNIGPTVATILAAVVALNQSTLVVVLTIIWGILVQQAENNLIVPKVMNKHVGLNPLVTIFALAVGAKVGGVIGTILAIPGFLVAETVVKTLVKNK